MAEVELQIQNGKKIYIPSVEEGIKLKSVRKGTPGQLTFSVAKDSLLRFTEGNAVRMKVDGKNAFYGYVFKKNRSSKDIIETTCYDQLRYFKNKDTYIYKKKTADKLLKMICNDFNLKAGKLADTKYVIDKKTEQNKTLFDIIQNALDETMQSKNKLYVLYDDFGRICLTDIADMRLNILICEDTAESLSYTSSIDEQTYNKVKLVYVDKEAGKLDTYIAQSSANMNKWGVLQYYNEEQSNKGMKAKANALLKLYNRKTRNLAVKGVAGDIRVRAGSSVMVSLDLGDMRVNNYMLVEEVTHTFENGEYTMDLKLVGGDFI